MTSKTLAALSSAAFCGVFLGVRLTAIMAYSGDLPGVPEWVETARQFRTMALVGFVICALGWVALDWLDCPDPDA